MAKMTPLQTALLDNVARDYSAYRTAKATLEANLRVEMERRLESLLVTASHSARKALSADVPKSRIGESIGVKNYITVQNLLELTDFDPATTAAPTPAHHPKPAPGLRPATSTTPRFHIDRYGHLIINATEGDRGLFERGRASGAFAHSFEDIAADSYLRTASFNITTPGNLEPVTDDWLEAYGDRHPIVALATARGSELAEAARAWLVSEGEWSE